jgi:hypothetical protein
VQFTKLLGNKLKSDQVIELLEHYDVDVIYDFDRLHEGTEDVYWASFYEQGFQFRFNKEQTLDVIFLYMQERDGFLYIHDNEVDVDVLSSFVEAKESFEEKGIEYITSPSDDPDHVLYQRWIKSKSGGFSAHYEFIKSKLRMITLSIVK